MYADKFKTVVELEKGYLKLQKRFSKDSHTLSKIIKVLKNCGKIIDYNEIHKLNIGEKDYPHPQKTLSRVLAISKNFTEANASRKLNSLIGYLSSERSAEVSKIKKKTEEQSRKGGDKNEMSKM